jgi:hypothetical protein
MQPKLLGAVSLGDETWPSLCGSERLTAALTRAVPLSMVDSRDAAQSITLPSSLVLLLSTNQLGVVGMPVAYVCANTLPRGKIPYEAIFFEAYFGRTRPAFRNRDRRFR